jgi:glycosyltransferase involved in cell wall biosynthesis
MRILVISHSCVVDVNQQVYVALNALPDTEVALLVPENWKSEYTGEPMAPRLLLDVTFPVWQRPVSSPGHVTLHRYRSLPTAEIRAFRPDVLLASQEPWSLSGWQAMGLARSLKIPYAFQTNQNILKKNPPPFSWIEQASYRRASLALAYSEEARQVMARKGLKIPSEIVPYATDTRLFTPRDASDSRRALGLDGATVVGYLGRLVPEKGNPVKVLLVGAGAAEADLRRQAGELGVADRVVFAGVVTHAEAPNYMACLDVFVLPSRTTPTWKEQFGRVIIEALSCGVPVVGSDSGQIPHLIRDTGGGLVFPEGDAPALTAALSRLTDSPAERRRLGEAGRAAVEERYTCEAVARTLRSLLAGIAGMNDPAPRPASSKVADLTAGGSRA